ncbi:DUF4352 domain-containing protein [Apibacter sp. HY039]|uniref:DUF4352 domain-containing protein n=1 Tax=Apibacter sp. HY039 TaxID=2501476 RepID=UPI000FEBAD1A|nr:DUF4352 domain-containing protein [Apibacter sp. HY039]
MNKHFKTLVSALTVAFFAFIAFGSLDDDKKKEESSSTTEKASTETAPPAENPSTTESLSKPETSSNFTKIGEPLKTKYFEVTVKKMRIEDRVKTGNEFADLKKEEGNRYLILNMAIKNISDESRMLSEGEVIINYNGKEYKFDRSETVMSEGWGVLLEQINPLTTKTTNLVFKIPAEIKGQAFYRPGRSGKDDLIDLGEIK